MFDRCRMVLRLVALLLILFPVPVEADGEWLDGDLTPWNAPGMPVPAAPAPPVIGEPRCQSLVRPPETAEDAAVAAQGWRLYSTYQRGWGITLVSGFLNFDAMCRPVPFQRFVFVDGVFAGTLAPEAMFPRTDGALTDANVSGASSAYAIYDRYAPTDGLCCPSDEAVVTFTIERTPAGPVVIPVSPPAQLIEPSPTSIAPSESEEAAQTAVYLSQLEAAGDFDALYEWLHPDAQAIIPPSVISGWYMNEWMALGPRPITVTGVEFVEWTWGVTGETYPHTAEISFQQPFADGTVATDIMRLVQDEHGEWRWFFGRDQAFVQEQIAQYNSDEVVANAQAVERRLTVQKSLCPPGYAGNVYIDDCAATPGAGILFRVGMPYTEAFTEYVPTDEVGIASFENFTVGLHDMVRVIEELPANTERFVVLCSSETGESLDVIYEDYSDSNPALGVVDVVAGPEGDVACQWFDVPVAGAATQ